VVLDLTGGTGTCLTTSLALNRSCIYNDIDPKQAQYALNIFNEGII